MRRLLLSTVRPSVPSRTQGTLRLGKDPPGPFPVVCLAYCDLDRIQHVVPGGPPSGPRTGEVARDPGEDHEDHELGHGEGEHDAVAGDGGDERTAEREPDRQPEQRPEDRDDHRLVADHRAHLRTCHADRTQQTQLAASARRSTAPACSRCRSSAMTTASNSIT